MTTLDLLDILNNAQRAKNKLVAECNHLSFSHIGTPTIKDLELDALRVKKENVKSFIEDIKDKCQLLDEYLDLIGMKEKRLTDD